MISALKQFATIVNLSFSCRLTFILKEISRTCYSLRGRRPRTLFAMAYAHFTGMQMDQLTREYTPAKFVQELEVKRGGELVFRMEGGISISENPNFRFTYAPATDDTLEVMAKDTDGNVFKATSAGKAS